MIFHRTKDMRHAFNGIDNRTGEIIGRVHSLIEIILRLRVEGLMKVLLVFVARSGMRLIFAAVNRWVSKATVC